MATTIKQTTPKQKSYCFPQERPVTKEELTQHIKRAMKTGYSLTEEELNQKMDDFLKNL